MSFKCLLLVQLLLVEKLLVFLHVLEIKLTLDKMIVSEYA